MPSAHWPVVVFDLDGTLVDTIPLIVASFQHSLASVLGAELPESRIRQWIGRPLIEAFIEVDPARAQELFDAYISWNLANSERLIRPVAGIDELLDHLADLGVRTGVVTSKRRSSADLALRLTGLNTRIPVVAALEDTTTHKPDPAPLRLAFEMLRTSGADAVYVGDAVVDVQAAAAAGAAAIAVTWGAGDSVALGTCGPHAVVSDVAGLHRALTAP